MSGSNPIIAPVPEAECVGRTEFDQRYRHINQPVVFRGAANDWPAVQQWDLKTLQAKLGANEVDLEVGELFSRIDVDQQGNLGSGERLRLSISDFVSAIETAEAKQTPLPLYLTEWKIFETAPELRSDLSGRYSDLFDRRFCAPMKCYVGTSGAFTPLHFDYAPNFTVQIFGHKRWTFHLPKSRQDILAYPAWSPMAHFSEVNDKARTQLFEENRDPSRFISYQVEAGPGDIVYVPEYWWHYVDTLDTSLSLHFFWKPPLLLLKQTPKMIYYKLRNVSFGSSISSNS